MTQDEDVPTGKAAPEVIEGSRADLEREWLWLVALDGDPARIQQLKRMLVHSANDAFDSRVLSQPELGGESGAEPE